MFRHLLAIFMILVSNSLYAVDATKNATKSFTIGKWQITEFAAPTQMIYRLSSNSINFGEKHIVFDFASSKRCTPSPAVMIIKRETYNPDLDDGRVILAYKIPNQVEVSELTKTAMQKDDSFVFFQFVGLTTTKLLQSKDILIRNLPQQGCEHPTSEPPSHRKSPSICTKWTNLGTFPG